MPPSLKLEIKIRNTNEWSPVGEVRLGDRDGTISDRHDGGRDIYLFGVDPIENIGYVLKSEFGIDTVSGETREISTAGFVTVAGLHHLESYEMDVRTDNATATRRIRFTYYEE